MADPPPLVRRVSVLSEWNTAEEGNTKADRRSLSEKRRETRLISEHNWLRIHNRKEFNKRMEERQKRRELRTWFELMDADGSGEISAEELEEPLVSLGFAENGREVRRMIAEVDVDGSGEIGFEEFFVMLTKNAKSDGQNPLLRLYAELSGDGAGGPSLQLSSRIFTYRRQILMNMLMKGGVSREKYCRAIEAIRQNYMEAGRDDDNDEEEEAEAGGQSAAKRLLLEEKRREKVTRKLARRLIDFQQNRAFVHRSPGELLQRATSVPDWLSERRMQRSTASRRAHAIIAAGAHVARGEGMAISAAPSPTGSDVRATRHLDIWEPAPVSVARGDEGGAHTARRARSSLHPQPGGSRASDGEEGAHHLPRARRQGLLTEADGAASAAPSASVAPAPAATATRASPRTSAHGRHAQRSPRAARSRSPPSRAGQPASPAAAKPASPAARGAAGGGSSLAAYLGVRHDASHVAAGSAAVASAGSGSSSMGGILSGGGPALRAQHTFAFPDPSPLHAAPAPPASADMPARPPDVPRRRPARSQQYYQPAEPAPAQGRHQRDGRSPSPVRTTSLSPRPAAAAAALPVSTATTATAPAAAAAAAAAAVGGAGGATGRVADMMVRQQLLAHRIAGVSPPRPRAFAGPPLPDLVRRGASPERDYNQEYQRSLVKPTLLSDKVALPQGRGTWGYRSDSAKGLSRQGQQVEMLEVPLAVKYGLGV